MSLRRLRSITINELIRDLASDAIFRMNLLMAFDMAVNDRAVTARKIWGLVRTAGGRELTVNGSGDNRVLWPCRSFCIGDQPSPGGALSNAWFRSELIR